MNPLSPEVRDRAAPLIQKSIERSNPDGNTVAEVLEAIEEGSARLWLGSDSAVVTTLLQNARVSLDEVVWHAMFSNRFSLHHGLFMRPYRLPSGFLRQTLCF